MAGPSLHVWPPSLHFVEWSAVIWVLHESGMMGADTAWKVLREGIEAGTSSLQVGPSTTEVLLE